MNQLRSLSVLITVLISPICKSDLIEVSDSFHSWQFDTDTEIQWLDLKYTDGMSITQATSELGTFGWVVATDSQFLAMYGNYFDADTTDGSVYGHTGPCLSFSGCSGPTTEIVETTTHTDIRDWTGAIDFADLFGETNESIQNYASGTQSHHLSSLGRYIGADSGDVLFGGVELRVYTSSVTDKLINTVGFVSTSGLSSSSSNRGVFMIRGSGIVPPLPVQIPEPGTLVLLVIGLAGKGLTRGRKA